MKFALSVGLMATAIVNGVAAIHRSKTFGPRTNVLVPPAGEPPVNLTNAKHGYFDQLIDHANPSLGTFKQFYYWDDYFFKGPGSPVVFFTPGEINVTNYYTYLTTNRTSGVIAQKIGAAVICLEHRYWGTSVPFSDFSTQNMQYLTLENAIADLNYFALNAKLPFDKTGASNADKAPWVLLGGSYSGALTAWTQATTKPSVMWAYYASSAVVQAIGNYWQYFYPETVNMAKNCSTDISRVVEHVDATYQYGSLKQQQDLKEMFGLGDLPNYNDFAAVLANGPYLWQGNQFYENQGFFDFCDTIEGVNANSTSIPGASGVGLTKALANYASYIKNELLPGLCESFGYYEGLHNVDCLDTYNRNSPMYTDTSLANTYDRQWNWMLCNEPFGYWQTGAPPQQQTIVSRLVDEAYWTRQCGLWFPTENGASFGLREGRRYRDVNAFTGGWSNTNTTRLIFVDGSNDPWRQSTVSSTIRPGGPLAWTPEEPVFVVPGGFHTSDLVTANGVANAGCAAVQAQVVNQIAQWVSEYPGSS